MTTPVADYAEHAALIFELEIIGPEGARQRYPIGELSTAAARTAAVTITLGRQAGNDLVLDDQRISRQHLLIACTPSGCRVVDLDSSNGTYVNDERIPPQVPVPIEPEDQVRAGSHQIILHQQRAASPEAVPSQHPVGEEAMEQARAVAGGSGAPPAPPPPRRASDGDPGFPPGLDRESRYLINYLPGIYHTDFVRRFLALFESILLPVEWNIDNFDLFLSAGTAPAAFLPWLEAWFDIATDPSWSESQRRELLHEAPHIFARRGTHWALSRVLEIYTGVVPTIIDTDPNLAPFTFKVHIPTGPRGAHQRELIERLIDAHKPAYTLYTLELGT